jgi:hypothetical protein
VKREPAFVCWHYKRQVGAELHTVMEDSYSMHVRLYGAIFQYSSR